MPTTSGVFMRPANYHKYQTNKQFFLSVSHHFGANCVNNYNSFLANQLATLDKYRVLTEFLHKIGKHDELYN